MRRQIQASRQRTGRPGAGEEPKPTGLAAESSTAAAAAAAQADRAQQNRQYQNYIRVNGTTGKASESARAGEALKEEPFPSAMTWSDLMTPGKEEDLGWLQKAPAARPRRPAESKTGNGCPSDVAQRRFPSKTGGILPQFRRGVGMDGECRVYVLVNELLLTVDE